MSQQPDDEARPPYSGPAPGYGETGPGQSGWGPANPQQYGQPGPYPGPAPYGEAPGYPQPYAAPLSASDERLWATLSHISVPFFGFILPLIVFLVFKDRSAWLKANSSEALNFSILYTLALFLGVMLSFVLIGLILLPVVAIGGLVFCILGAIAANRGEVYRYPLNWRLVR